MGPATHFSGGVHSWFWSMYVLLTLEATFLLENKLAVRALGACGALLYGALLAAEYSGLIPAIAMPFEDGRHHQTLCRALRRPPNGRFGLGPLRTRTIFRH